MTTPCNDLNLTTFRVSGLSTYNDIDDTDIVLVIESGSALFSRKTTINKMAAYYNNSGLSGSYSGSFTGSADLHGEFSGAISGSELYGTASYSISASYAGIAGSIISSSHALQSDSSISASHATTSSFANEAGNAQSSSYALSSSHAEQADSTISSSYAVTASYLQTQTTANITNTVYFDRVELTGPAGLVSVDNIIGVTYPGKPTTTDGDWDVYDIGTALTTAGVTIPTSFPKSAIINVYHSSSAAIADRNSFALFTAHVDSSYGTLGNYQMQAAWAVGEDSGGGGDHYLHGGVYFSRMSTNSNSLAVQYTRLIGSGGQRGQLVVDLIGVQY